MLPPVIPPGSSPKDKNSSKRTLPCYKENHHSQELSWWETIKVLESTHLSEVLNVTACSKGQSIHLPVKKAHKVLYALTMTKFKLFRIHEI